MHVQFRREGVHRHSEGRSNPQLDDISIAMGIAVESRIFIPLLLKHIEAEAAKNSIKALVNILVHPR